MELFNYYMDVIEKLHEECLNLEVSINESMNKDRDLETNLDLAQNLYNKETQTLLSVTKNINNMKFNIKKAKIILEGCHSNATIFRRMPAKPFEKDGMNELKCILKMSEAELNSKTRSLKIPLSSDEVTLKPHEKKRTKLSAEQFLGLTPQDFSVEKLLGLSPFRVSPRHPVSNSSNNRAIDMHKTIKLSPTVPERNNPVFKPRYQTHLSPLPHFSQLTFEKSNNKYTVSGNSKVKTKNSSPKTPSRTPGNFRKHVLKETKKGKGQFCAVCLDKLDYVTKNVSCTRCNVSVHSNCSSLMSPCLNISKIIGKIKDLVPSTKPMVPAFIVRCIETIEERGIEGSNLYKEPASDKEIKALLKEKLKVKGKIHFSCVSSTHTLCGSVIEFLKSLEEPLICLSKLQGFKPSTIIENKNNKENGLLALLQDLDEPNRDTFAFIVLHLKRIVLDTSWSRLELSTFFAPYLIRYGEEDIENIPIGSTETACMLLNEFISLPNETWTQLLYPNKETNKAPLKWIPKIVFFN